MIINPWFFYFMQLCNGLGAMATVLGILLIIMAVGYVLVIWFSTYCPPDKEEIELMKKSKKLLIIGGVFILLSVIIPSKETLIEMQIARLGTTENIDSAVTYVIDKVEQFEDKDKEE